MLKIVFGAPSSLKVRHAGRAVQCVMRTTCDLSLLGGEEDQWEKLCLLVGEDILDLKLKMYSPWQKMLLRPHRIEKRVC